ncbi:MAG: alpha/beta hydrolase [Actinobacteria bacterium]|nr:alpha/beta hydrolase [Actinomycetota bacterium]
MRLDRGFLAEHASHTNEGILERALHLEVGGERCFSVLYLPDEPREPGFAVCHSYGLELLTIRRTERAVARALAGAGHPVISFHGRGYGDSTGDLAAQGLDRHVEDLRAAADRLRAEAGVQRLGLFGARFGGLVAGTAAREGGVDRLVLVNPATSGPAYFGQLLREMRLVQMSLQSGGPRRSMTDLLDQLDREGVLDVLGYAVHRGLYRDLEGVDLTADLGAFAGPALLLHVAKRPGPPKDLLALAERIGQAGGECEVAFVREPPGAVFGSAAFVSTNDPMARVDVSEPMVEEIASRTVAWMGA